MKYPAPLTREQRELIKKARDAAARRRTRRQNNQLEHLRRFRGEQAKLIVETLMDALP